MELDDRLCTHYLNLNFSENFLGIEDMNLHSELPYPINKPLKDSEVDVISKFNQDVANYKNRLTALRKEFQLVHKKIMKQSFTNSHALITKDLLNFCNEERHETPFLCDYNPYYATGTLTHFNLNNCNYLLRPDYKNNLRITDMANPWRSHKLHLDCEINNNITGISSYKNSDLYLLSRHGKHTNLHRIRDVNDMCETVWTKKFKHSLIDSQFDGTKVGVVLSDLKFRLFDIQTCERINLMSSNIQEETHSEFISDHTMSILGLNHVKIIDLRSSDCELLFQPQLNKCDYLCSMKMCDNLIYVATRHYLIRTDLRFSKSVEFCSHMLKYSPCYMDFVDNVLCISSQKCGEKVLFTGEPINSLPVDIPSIADTLKKCRLQGGLLLRSDVDAKLQKSVGGVKLFSDRGDTFLYSVNSSGEIFKQKVMSTTQIGDSGPIESLYRWVNKLPKPEKPLCLTGVVNASDARFALNKRIRKEYLAKYRSKSKKVNYFLNHYNMVYSKKNLGELATNFASIWDVDEEEEREDVDLVPEVAPIEKVSKWIESSFFN